MRIKNNILLILLILTTSIILISCSKPPVAPEGVNQDFYDDMIVILDKLEQTKGELNTDNGEDLLKEYIENKILLTTTKEVDILEAVEDLHFWVWLYNDQEEINIEDKMRINNKIDTVSYLMEIELDKDDFVK